MYRLVVLTDSDTADGFRLAGVSVHAVDTAEDTRARVVSLLDDDSVGIIAVNGRLMGAIDERLEKRIDSLMRPIVVALPFAETLELAEEPVPEVSRLLKRAIGFDVTLKRGSS